MIGPLQLLVIGFDEDKYAKEIMVELKNLRKEGIIRLFDLLYIIKHQDGTIASKEVDDLAADEQRTYGTLVKSLLGMTAEGLEHVDADKVAESLGSTEGEFGLSEDEIQDLADQLPDGSSAILVIFEHSWARGVKAAMVNAGGTVRAQGIINPDTLLAASNELAHVIEAVDKAETSTMEKMSEAMVDAKAQEDQARSQAAETVAQAEAIEAAALAALAAAHLKEEEAAQAVADSEARVEAAQAHAAEVAAEAEAMEDEAFAQAEAVRRAAKRQEEKAMTEAANVVHEAEEIEAMAVLRAMNALIAAELIEKEAVREALEAVIAANVIEARAAREAARALRAG